MPLTLEDVAKMVGVSRSTVSRVINNEPNVNEETRQKVEKIIKELNLPSVKFGIMEKDFMTGEQVLKLSALPTKEVLLASLVAGLKSPIFGLHRALSCNLQKFVLALNAIAKAKPALAVAITASAPVVEAVSEPTPEPEMVKAKIEEQPKEETKSEDVKSEGGEN